MAKVERQCSWCSESFLANSWDVNRGRGIYCSISCKSAYGRSLQDQSGVFNPAWKGGVAKINADKKRRDWANANPQKKRAHHLVERALDRGDLVRGPCAHCGAIGKVDAHHEDYEAPLDVTWLCRPCHLKHHRSAA